VHHPAVLHPRVTAVALILFGLLVAVLPAQGEHGTAGAAAAPAQTAPAAGVAEEPHDGCPGTPDHPRCTHWPMRPGPTLKGATGGAPSAAALPGAPDPVPAPPRQGPPPGAAAARAGAHSPAALQVFRS
jgi:hypothetical protein